MSTEATTARRPGATSTGLLLGSLLAPAALGISAAPVALPTLAGALHVGVAQTAWVLAAYTLTMSIGTAIGGRLTDLHGTRLTLILCAALLAAGTLCILVAPTFAVLVAGRLIQGAGAGVAGMLAFDLAAELFSDVKLRATAIGVAGSLVGLVSGAGALLGGALTEAVGWRGALMLPCLAALAVAGCARFATVKHGTASQAPLDVSGAAWCLGVSSALVLVLQSGSIGLPLAVVLALAALAVIGTVGLVRHVRKQPAGFLPAAVIGSRRFALASACGFTLFAGYVIIQFAAPRFLIGEHPMSPVRIGLILLPAGLASAVISRYAGVVANRIGAFRLAFGFALLSAAGLLIAAAGSRSAPTTVVALAMCVSAYTGGQSAIMTAVPDMVEARFRGISVGIIQLLFITGGSLGSAAVGGVSSSMSLPAAVAVLAALPLVGALLTIGQLRHRADPADRAQTDQAQTDQARTDQARTDRPQTDRPQESRAESGGGVHAGTQK